MSLRSVSPTTGEVLESFEETTASELERILARAQVAFLDWRRRPLTERGALLREAARLLRAKQGDYARAMALEMGKPIAQGAAEVEKCAWGCEYYAEHAARFLAPRPRETDAPRSSARSAPLAPVPAVCPRNFPFRRVSRSAPPAHLA